jgi:hypothetical protein
MHLINAAPTDGIVCLLLDHHTPGVLQIPRWILVKLKLREKWLNDTEQAVLRLLIEALQIPPRREHIGQYKHLRIVTQRPANRLAMPYGLRDDRFGVIGERFFRQLILFISAVERRETIADSIDRKQVIAALCE